MAILQLANDWHGDMKPGKDAISFLENKVQVTSGNFRFSILSRTYHEFLISNDLARGFYYYNNDVELDEELRIHSALQAKSYSGEGIQLGYTFEISPTQTSFLIMTPTLTALRLTDIIWGDLEGELFYSNTQDWGGTLDLDYHYTKDHVVRRPLNGDYIGQLYGLDFEATYQSEYITAYYQGINIASRVYWDGLPTTTAQISTQTAFLLFGYEYYDDVVLTVPAFHYGRIALPLGGSFASKGISFRSDGYFTAIREFYFHGIEWVNTVSWFSKAEEVIYSVQYDPTHSSSKVSFSHPNFSTTLASQTLDLSKSQQLIVNFAFNYTF
ncbi:MAG: hypothetical protein V7765_14230 [Oleispira sp.]